MSLEFDPQWRTAGFSIRQTWPFSGRDTKVDGAVSVIQLARNNWGGNIRSSAIVPFDFQAMVISPNSHIGNVVIVTPGGRPQFCGVGNALQGDFKAGTILLPFRLVNWDATPTGGYLELLIFPSSPDTAFPTQRATYIKQTDGGVALYDQDVNDPDFIPGQPTRTVCEKRTTATVSVGGIVGFSLHIQYQFGGSVDWSNVNAGFSVILQPTYDDPNNFLSDGTAYVFSIPPGATSLSIIDNSTGLPLVNAFAKIMIILED